MDISKQLLVLQKAVQYHCAECHGFDELEGIAECTARACPLWPFRNGANPTERHLETYAVAPSTWARMRRSQSRNEWSGEPHEHAAAAD